MYVKHLLDCSEFVAGDNSLLREILNPRKEDISIHYSLAWAYVKPGEKTLVHELKVSEVYFILKGKGTMHINNEKKNIDKGNTIYIPPNAAQFIENTGEENLEFLCIVDPAWQPEVEQVL
ncbi:MAG: cupin domain-containing protein [bacterium]